MSDASDMLTVEELKARAAALAERPEEVAGPGARDVVLVLRSRGESFAVPIAAVLEVLPSPRLARVPNTPPAVAGLVNHRGEIVPALDVGVLFGLTTPPSVAYAIVVANGALVAALTADGVPELVEYDRQQIAPAAPAMARGDLVGGVVRIGSRLVTLLNVEPLVQPGIFRAGGAPEPV